MLSFKESISPLKIIFFTALILLAALSVFSYKQNLKLIDKAAWVNHTNLVKLELANTLSELKDAEADTRAFRLTAIMGFLKSYRTAVNDIPGSLHLLDSLVSDNPNQQSNFNVFRSLTEKKLVMIKALIDSGADKPLSYDIILQSKEDMDQIRTYMAIMMHREEKLLADRTMQLNEVVSFTPIVNVVVAGFAILLLVFSYFKIVRELEKSKGLQNELVHSNIILEKSNSELAQFAYVASHDLQEPLRKIQTFISRIYDTEKGISEKGRDYFDRVNMSAKRMQQLIRDILSYSRLDNSEYKLEKTDLNDVLEMAKDQLADFIKEGDAEIHAEKLPLVNAVKYQFVQLFQNLLSNALKFAKPGQKAVIEIKSDTVKGNTLQHPAANKNITYHRIQVADNGIGFDGRYNERIFKIFHRLNTKEAFEGNGIGLSIVKKIIEDHGGFVTADGCRDEGATFCLYLPV